MALPATAHVALEVAPLLHRGSHGVDLRIARTVAIAAAYIYKRRIKKRHLPAGLPVYVMHQNGLLVAPPIRLKTTAVERPASHCAKA